MVIQLSEDSRLSSDDQTAVQAKYWIPRHVRLCVTHDGIVFLDLAKDQYVGFGVEAARVLASVVAGLNDAGGYTECETEGAEELADVLVERGLLTRDLRVGSAARSAALKRYGCMVAVGEDMDGAHRVGISHVVVFLISCIRSAYALRVRSVQYAVHATQTRRQRKVVTTKSFDAEEAAELVRIFRRLRSYFFTTKGRCLFHALALVNFFAHYGLFPHWVVGVKTFPFEAHSWVQYENLVLDGTPEQVCFFTPILAV